MSIILYIAFFLFGFVVGMYTIAFLYNEQYFEKYIALQIKIKQYDHAIDLVNKSKEMLL